MSEQNENGPSQFGEFEGDVITKWLVHGGHDRLMRLEEDFSFIRSSGEKWTAPKCMKIDGASIPRFFWSYASPYVGNFRRASVIHDHYCVTKERSSRTTHRVFYEACRADGTRKIQAKVMYLAIKWFGPDWIVANQKMTFGLGLGQKSYGAGEKIPVPPLDDNEDFQALRDWVENNDPDIDTIDELVETKRTPDALKSFR